MAASNRSGENENTVTDSGGYYRVTRDDLPLHCPMPGTALWNSHPRVFLPIEEAGTAVCPYCGTRYVLAETR